MWFLIVAAGLADLSRRDRVRSAWLAVCALLLTGVLILLIR